jgi:hypothetical protein
MERGGILLHGFILLSFLSSVVEIWGPGGRMDERRCVTLSGGLSKEEWFFLCGRDGRLVCPLFPSLTPMSHVVMW